MRYTLLLYYPEVDVDAIGAETVGHDQRDLGAFAAELDRAGALVSAEVLQPFPNTTTVRMGRGGFEVHDGTATPGALPLGAVVTIEVVDRAAALAWARQAPAVPSCVVEIWPSASSLVDDAGAAASPEAFDTLRALADEGYDDALDRLADLTDRHGDVEGLRELLDEGSQRAGEHLTRRASARGDLADLQRIAEAGYEPAEHELTRLLAGGKRP